LPRSSTLRDNLHLHGIVIIFGFTAVLGKLITLPALELTVIRMLLAAIGLGVIYLFRKKAEVSIGTRQFLFIVFVGILVAVHWATFFGAIKLANVSVALACFSTTTLFTSLLEPLFEKRKIHPVEVAIGLVIIVGLCIIFRFESGYYLGMIVGIFSAFLASLFSVLNAQLTKKHDFHFISLIELSAGFLFLLLIYLLSTENGFTLHQTSWMDLMWLTILAWVCTSYAFTAILELMRRISAFRVNLAISLEPIYGILLAWLIFGASEQMSAGFYIGAVIVFAAVIAYPFLVRSRK